MEHQVFVPVPAARLREALADPVRVAGAVPGLQQDAGADPLTGRLKLRAGGSSVTYRGAARVSAREDGTYEISGEAAESRGPGRAGFSLTLTLIPAPTGTNVAVTATADAGGRATALAPAALASALTRLLTRFVQSLATPEADQETPAPEASGLERPAPDTSAPGTPAPEAIESGTPAPGRPASDTSASQASGSGRPASDTSASEAAEPETPEQGTPAPETPEPPAPSVFDTEVPPPSLTPEPEPEPGRDPDRAPEPEHGLDPGPASDPDLGRAPEPEHGLDPVPDPLPDPDDLPARFSADPGPGPGADDSPPAEAAHARRTMIGRSAEEVDHAPPRGRYAPVPAPQPVTANPALRWAAPAAAVALGTAIVVTRALRRRR